MYEVTSYIRSILKQSLKIKDSSLDEFEILKDDLLNRGMEEDVLRVLKKLKKDYLLFIISSNKESTLKEFFDKDNLGDLFDRIYGVETHKKKDVKFEMLFDEHNLDKDDVVFVTDTLGDLLEAKKIGVKSIGIDFGFHERERLKRGSPWRIATNFNEVEKFIEELR